MKNSFYLSFDKATTSLAGFPYGEAVFIKQVSKTINYNEDITIVFPPEIKRVASSFVQGFFSQIINMIGYGGFERQVKIIAGTDTLAEEIRENIR